MRITFSLPGPSMSEQVRMAGLLMRGLSDEKANRLEDGLKALFANMLLTEPEFDRCCRRLIKLAKIGGIQ